MIKPHHHKFFDTQEEGEKVLIVARRYWFAYFWAFALGGFVYAFALVAMIAPGIFENPLLEVPRTAIIAFFSLICLFILLGMFLFWVINYLDVQIVTNRHIVDIDQSALFSRKISQLTLDSIEDVSAKKGGLFETLLNFGDVHIQTAAEKPNFIFMKVKDPYVMATEIMKIKNRYSPEPNSPEYIEVVKKGKKE